MSRRAPTIAWTCLAVLLIAGVLPVGSQQTETGPRTFVDDLDRKIILTHTPRRIISLAPSITETLFAIGLGERVVGVTQYCDYPPEAQAKPKVGYIHPNLESIVALQPDLVLAPREFLRGEVLGKLEQLNIPTYVMDAGMIDDVLSHIRTLGRMLGALDAADELAGRMQKQLEAIKARTAMLPRPRVLYVLNSEPLITVGPGSFIHQAIELAGGSNIAEPSRVAYPRLSMETVLKANPDLIIFPSSVVERGSEGERQRWQRWATLSAVKQGRFYRLPNELLNRPGPRVVQGVETLARILHPDTFGERDSR